MLDPLADTISKCFQSLDHCIAVTHKMRDRMKSAALLDKFSDEKRR